MNNILKGYRSIHIDKLVKANWNYKEDEPSKLEKLKSNIKTNGQLENIIIRELDTGFFEVVNGNHRLQAFKDLGIEEIMVFDLGKITINQAKRIAIETNETKFITDQIKFNDIIVDLVDEFGYEDLEVSMPYNTDDLTSFYEMNNNDWSEFETERTPQEEVMSNFNLIFSFNGDQEELILSSIEKAIKDLGFKTREEMLLKLLETYK